MMTLALALLAVSAFFLWRRKARWGWAVVMAVLVIGIVIFLRDVDFSSSLGVQL
jgi:drug/metabolite transporter (DMT)-like permease